MRTRAGETGTGEAVVVLGYGNRGMVNARVIVWVTSRFDLRFAFVILGQLITGIGVGLRFRKEVEAGDTQPAALMAD